MKFLTSVAATFPKFRQAIVFSNSENKAVESTREILNDLREQTANLLDKRAEAWIGENKLIHAGAARKLAKELREKLDVPR